MFNCDIYADVDFGHGPVEVRCTELGDHKVHRCEVVLLHDSQIGPDLEERKEVHSIFDQ